MNVSDINDLGYHTSADALLPVYSKVGNAYCVHEPEQTSRVADMLAGQSYQEKLRVMEGIGRSILSMDYPAACLKLAEIISQLNEQK